MQFAALNLIVFTCIPDSTCITAHRMTHNPSLFACSFGHKYFDSSDDYGNMIFFAYLERLSVNLMTSNHFMVISFNIPQSMGSNRRAFQIYLRIHKKTITRIVLV